METLAIDLQGILSPNNSKALPKSTSGDTDSNSFLATQKTAEAKIRSREEYIRAEKEAADTRAGLRKDAVEAERKAAATESQDTGTTAAAKTDSKKNTVKTSQKTADSKPQEKKTTAESNKAETTDDDLKAEATDEDLSAEEETVQTENIIPLIPAELIPLLAQIKLAATENLNIEATNSAESPAKANIISLLAKEDGITLPPEFTETQGKNTAEFLTTLLDSLKIDPEDVAPHLLRKAQQILNGTPLALEQGKNPEVQQEMLAKLTEIFQTLKPETISLSPATSTTEPSLQPGQGARGVAYQLNELNALLTEKQAGLPASDSTKTNTVSMIMGERFRELLQLQEQNAFGAKAISGNMPLRHPNDISLRQQTMANLDLNAANQGPQTSSDAVQGIASELMSGNTDDGTTLDLAMAKSESGLVTSTTGSSQHAEPFSIETGASRQPTSPAMPDSATVRLPSGAVFSENQVVNHVVEKISLSGPLNSGTNTITIKMYPEELGHLNLKLEVTNDSVKAHLIAQNPQAQEILERHIPRLREALEAQGLKLDDIQVTVDSGQNQNKGGHFQQNGQWAQSSPALRQNRELNRLAQELNVNILPETTNSAENQMNGRLSLRI